MEGGLLDGVVRKGLSEHIWIEISLNWETGPQERQKPWGRFNLAYFKEQHENLCG